MSLRSFTPLRTPTGYTTKISRYEKPPIGVEQLAKTELQAQPEARGPKGTVPVVRFDVETYLSTERDLPENPSDELTKIPPPSPPASNNRYYGVWQRFDTFFGTSGRINIWDTAGPNSGETSIAQTGCHPRRSDASDRTWQDRVQCPQWRGAATRRHNPRSGKTAAQILFFKARALKVNKQRTTLTNVHHRSRRWQREPGRRWHEDVQSQPGFSAQGHLQTVHSQYCAYTRHG